MSQEKRPGMSPGVFAFKAMDGKPSKCRIAPNGVWRRIE
jgi:hypothetical protein